MTANSTNSSSNATKATTTTTATTITKINFALHPKRQLRISLHRAIPTNPHYVVNQLLQNVAVLPPSLCNKNNDNNSNSDYFAIMDASKIVCMDQIAIGANSAQLRRFQFDQKNKIKNSPCSASNEHENGNGNGNNSGNGNENDKQNENANNNNNTNTNTDTTRPRGLVLETILCCAGSTNTASVLRDYAFDKHSEAAAKLETLSSSDDDDARYDIFVLGYCETDEEFEHVITNEILNLSPAEDHIGIESYFQREKSEKEINDLLKVYKLTKDEVVMCGSSLEKAVCNRVAAKFFV